MERCNNGTDSLRGSHTNVLSVILWGVRAWDSFGPYNLTLLVAFSYLRPIQDQTRLRAVHVKTSRTPMNVRNLVSNNHVSNLVDA
jgi:hypothetical protein